MCTATRDRMRITHVSIPTVSKHREASKISVHVNTVSINCVFFFIHGKIFQQQQQQQNCLLTGAPVYISNPHFYLADPKLLDAVEGLKPNKSIHESYFKIQPVSARNEIPIRSIQLNSQILITTILIVLFFWIMFGTEIRCAT